MCLHTCDTGERVFKNLILTVIVRYSDGVKLKSKNKVPVANVLMVSMSHGMI